MFGRGGEEALVLREAGIPFEVVPGVTAGVAAPAYAGIPVTHRDVASGVAFVTGHEDPAKPDSALDWPALAAFPGTLVFYMGVRALPRIAEQLIAGGREPDEPVAVVEQGTLPRQRTLTATLATVAEQAAGRRHPRARDHARRSGRGAARRSSRGSSHGRCSAARSRSRARGRRRARSPPGSASSAPRSSRRRRSGSSRCPPRSLTSSRYDLVCVTSPNGATRLLDLLRDARDLAGTTVAAIGPGTARALRERGIEPDVVPERAVAEGLVEALRAHAGHPGADRACEGGARRAPRGAEGARRRGRRAAALRDRRRAARRGDPRRGAAAADYVLFTSASSVRHFAAAAGDGALGGPRLVSIGPATSAELRAHGASPDLEADPHTPDGLVAVLLADAARGSLGASRRRCAGERQLRWVGEWVPTAAGP